MDIQYNRTLIAGLMTQFYPEMQGKSSDEWQAFLNEKSGLDIRYDEKNGPAFDRWRQAIKARHGIPCWPH